VAEGHDGAGRVAEDLQAGRLVRLLPRYRLHEAQVFLLMPSTRQLPMRKEPRPLLPRCACKRCPSLGGALPNLIR
jgi:hypothetical protein